MVVAQNRTATQAAGVSAVAAPFASRYRRREPERTLLHATVRAHWKTFLAEVEERGEVGASLPRFVVGEFERYLACGILAHGFARVRCTACGDELLVALSCKGRGFCPSCTTRRMHDTAAHLVDRVIPQVPVRQWVLSLPRWARFLLARDPQLITRTLDVALRAIFAHQRLRAGARARRFSSCVSPRQQPSHEPLECSLHLQPLPARRVCLLPARSARLIAGTREARKATELRLSIRDAALPELSPSNKEAPMSRSRTRTIIILTLAAGLFLACTPEVTDIDRVQQSTAMSAAKYSDWSPPVSLGPVVNSTANEQNAQLSKDGLAIYFSSNRPGGFGAQDIYVTRRASARRSVGSTGESRSADQYSNERFCTERFHRWTSAFLRVRSSRWFWRS